MAAANPHLRAILIAGALAATAVALGMWTLARQQAGSSVPVVLPHGRAQEPKPATAKPRVNPYVKAALAAGLPQPVAAAFDGHRVVVVTVYLPNSDVDVTTKAEARAGAGLAGAGFVAVDASRGGAADSLARSLGVLSSPTTLILSRADFAKPVTTLAGFVDRDSVAQAAENADPAPRSATFGSSWARQADALCADARLSAKLVAGLGALTPAAGTAAKTAKFLSVVKRELALSRRAASPKAAAELAVVAPRAASAANALGATSCAEAL